MNEFRRAHVQRTFVGDLLRDPLTGQMREVVARWGAGEYIEAKVDGRFYRYRHSGERNSLASPVRAIRNERTASNWRLT